MQNVAYVAAVISIGMLVLAQSASVSMANAPLTSYSRKEIEDAFGMTDLNFRSFEARIKALENKEIAK